MNNSSIDRHLFVILGATGSLSTLKLLPALYSLLTQKNLRDHCQILGLGTKDIGDEGFRKKVREALQDAGHSSEEAGRWCEAYLHYQPLGRSEQSYPVLAERITSLEQEYGLPGNRVFYLAIPPQVVPTAIKGIGRAGLQKSSGWTRIVIEKPFGRDLQSARELNRLVHQYFEESQIYRIDHYLGKETVQNLLIFRFANSIFESLWNRDRVECVEITVAESIGIEGRSDYYDQAGALRDIIQNHMAQLLSLVAMEFPAVFVPEFIRSEKVKVLHSIPPIRLQDVVFGQYQKGKIEGKKVPGYREEQGINPDSKTETYVALRLVIDNWRWQGVPFYLRTGKRLPQRVTQIVVHFRRSPVCIFKPHNGSQIHSNKLLITLQPDEGFHLYFDVKVPGEPLRLRTERLHFHYKQVFDRIPEAYQTLLYDILTGDQTLFVRSDEVEASWQLFTPLIEKKIPVFPYAAGTWGPEEADRLLQREGRRWWIP